MSIHLSPEEHLLSNGIPVLLQDWDSPVATTYWWNQVGSIDEKPREYGFAHFLEHMLFKDAAAKETGVPSSGKLAQTVESLGGDINAYTSFDQTVYHVTGSERHWEKWIDGLGSMAKPQRFLKEDFQREREVILEELRRSLDSPSRQCFQALFSMTYGKHAYGRPVIGYERTLKQATCAELESFYRKHYVSSRMGIILVGPLGKSPAERAGRRKDLLKICERRFGSDILPRKVSNKAFERSRLGLDVARKAGGVQTKVLPFDVKSPSLTFSWKAPSLKDSRLPALDVALDVLSMGELSRFYQRLFLEKSIVTDISGSVFSPSGHGSGADLGMAYVQMDAENLSKLSEAGPACWEEMSRLEQEGPTSEELDRVVVNAESEKLFSTQSVDGVASRLGYSRFSVEDMAFDSNYLDRIKSLKPRDIQRALLDTCIKDAMSVLYFVPKGDVKSVDVAAMAAQIPDHGLILKSPHHVVRQSRLHQEGPAPIQFRTLKDGSELIVVEKPDSNTFAVHLSMLGGSRLEPRVHHGVSNLMSMVWPKGTPRRGARDIAREIEGRAASLEGFSGRNSMGMELTALTRDFDPLCDVFSDVLLNPVFPKDEVDHARRVIEDSLRSLEDHSSSLCSKLFYETLYDEHPYGRLTAGTLESIAGLNSEALAEWHRMQVHTRPWVIAVVGGISADEIQAKAENWVAARKRPQASGSQASQLAEPILPAPRWVEKKVGREQAHLMVGGLGYRIGDSDRMEGRLLQTLLGGQSGRLFLELREKRSLAYTVSPMSSEGLERGSVGTYIGCAPSKVQESLKGIQGVLEALAKKGPSKNEMKRAQEFYLGRRAMDLQGESSMASFLGLEKLYNLKHQEEAEWIRSVQKVSDQGIRRACEKLLCRAPQVTAMVV